MHSFHGLVLSLALEEDVLNSFNLELSLLLKMLVSDLLTHLAQASLSEILIRSTDRISLELN